MADISKIVIPALDGSPGGIYNIKDTYARQLLSGGIQYNIAWNGTSIPVVANIPSSVAIRYNNTIYQGTLSADAAEAMTFYLIKEDGAGGNRFMEYVAVTDPDTHTKTWEMIGYAGDSMDTLGALAYIDDIDIDKGLGVNVIGENATLVAQPSSVSFTAHTQRDVLGTDVSFEVTDPTYTLSPSKANISLSRTTDVSLIGTTASVVGALDTTNSTKDNFLKSNTTFTKKKIASTSIYGVGEVTAQSVNFSGSTKRKLLTDTLIPAKALTINGSDLVTGDETKLVTTQVTVVGGTTSVNNVTGVTKGTLDVDTMNKVTAITTNNASHNEWKDTVANLDIHMYNSNTDGTSGSLANADTETLIISFKTLPSLKISATDVPFAKGNITGSSGAAEFATGVTSSPATVATAGQTVTLATGATDANGGGSTVLNGFTSSSVSAATVDTAVRFATGKIAASNSQNNSESNGDEVYTSLSGTVNVPTKNAQSTDVLTPTLTTATNVASDVNVVTDVTTSTAQAYTAIAFENTNVLSGVSVVDQPAFSASVTSNANGDVLTGVSISKSTSGRVNVPSSYTGVEAITALGTGTAAAQSVSFNSKDLKKVALYDDIAISTEVNPIKRYLNFVMPNGGRLAFVKYTGTPTSVSLQYSFDGANWNDWTEGNVTIGSDTYTGFEIMLASGDRLYIRNSSTTSVGLNNSSNYYKFIFENPTYAYGNIMSLLCKNPENATISTYCFNRIFSGSLLVSTPDMPATTGATGCYFSMYSNCALLTNVAFIALQVVPSYGCLSMFNGCSLVNEIRCGFTDASAEACLNSWLTDVASVGTIYVPSNLTIPTNKIPENWDVVSTN